LSNAIKFTNDNGNIIIGLKVIDSQLDNSELEEEKKKKIPKRGLRRTKLSSRDLADNEDIL